jgi:phage tail sheath gpL-like
MTTILQPKVTVNKLPAFLPATLQEQKILVIGQKNTINSISGNLYENISKDQIRFLSGDNSFLLNSLNAIFDVFEKSGSLILPQVDIIPLDDNVGGIQATSTLTIAEIGGATNQATVAGQIDFIIGSEYLYKFSIPVTVGQAIISGTGNISDALADAINANTDIPLSASNASGVITLTCTHKGTIGNSITVKVNGLTKSGANYVLGNVGVTITSFTSGATDPIVTNILDVVGNRRYQTITHPIEYGIDFSVINFLDSRFNVNNNILDGVCIVKNTDTLANLKTNLGLLNSQSLVYLCDKIVTEDTFKGSALIDLNFVLAARFAALRALRLTENANITRIVLTSSVGVNDTIGGIHISTLPYFNTPIFSVSPMEQQFGFTQTEIEELENEGGSVIGNNVVGNSVILGEIVTTYKTDTSANPDPTWHYLNTVDTLSVSAEYFFNNIKSDFAQSRLTTGDLINGYAMVNEESFKGQMKKYFIDLSEVVVVPSGKEAIDYFLNNLDIIIDLLDGKITANTNLPIVTQLREILVNLRTTFL